MLLQRSFWSIATSTEIGRAVIFAFYFLCCSPSAFVILALCFTVVRYFDFFFLASGFVKSCQLWLGLSWRVPRWSRFYSLMSLWFWVVCVPPSRVYMKLGRSSWTLDSISFGCLVHPVVQIADTANLREDLSVFPLWGGLPLLTISNHLQKSVL